MAQRPARRIVTRYSRPSIVTQKSQLPKPAPVSTERSERYYPLDVRTLSAHIVLQKESNGHVQT